MTDTPPPKVLFPVEPISGESLSGFIARAAHENRHGSVSPLLNAIGYSWPKASRIAVRQLDLIPRLAQALQIDEAVVAAMTHHEVRSGGEPFVDFFGAIVARGDLGFRLRRVSPLALRSSAHHRAIWCHALIPYCAETGGALIDRCPSPECGARLGWYKTSGIDRCERCQGDLKDAPVDVIDEAVRRQLAPVVALLDPDPLVHGPAIAALPEPLQTMNRGIVFELGWRLALLCNPKEIYCDARDRKNLSPQEKVEHLLLAGQILSDWPNGFRELAASLGPDHLSIRLRWFRSANRIGGLIPELEPIIREYLPGLVEASHVFTAALTFGNGLISSIETRKVLGRGATEIAKLKKLGLLRNLSEINKNEKKKYGAFSKSDIEDLLYKLKNRFTAESMTAKEGLPQYAFEQLICLGLVREASDPALRALYPRLQIERSSFDDLMRDLAVGGRQPHGMTIPLDRALLAIGGREKPYGQIIKAMLSGKIPYHIDACEAKLVKKIQVSCDAIELISSLYFDRGDYPDFRFAKGIQRGDAQVLLNVPKNHISAAFDKVFGVAEAGGVRGSLLAIEKVVDLAAKRIAEAEIKMRWTGGSRTLPIELSRDPKLQLIDYFGRDRAAVESYFEG